MSAIVHLVGARLAGCLMLLLAASAAHAQSTLPAARSLEALVKSSLISFNDANLTGNYTVFHAKLSKPFREQFPPERLKAAFKEFADKSIDLDIVAALTPIYGEPPDVNADGKLLIRGYFATEPTRVSFDMDFIPSDGDWKLIRIHVHVAPAPGHASASQ